MGWGGGLVELNTRRLDWKGLWLGVGFASNQFKSTGYV